MLHGPSMPPRAGGSPREIIVLLHGLGADGQDLIGLAPALAEQMPQAAFFAPDAPQPCDMAPYGRQWFSVQDRTPARMLAGARQAAPQLDAFLDALLERYQLPASRLALVGFSQGTMMSLHVAPRRPVALGAVLGFSGRLIGPETLAAETLSRPPVMLIHGDADDVVPVELLPLAVNALQAVDVPVQWIVRPGLPHSIDPFGIAEGLRFLRAMLPVVER